MMRGILGMLIFLLGTTSVLMAQDAAPVDPASADGVPATAQADPAQPLLHRQRRPPGIQHPPSQHRLCLP